MTIPQGTQFGPYRILELIGSGGMGEVYRAFDTRLEREVALKLVSDSYLASDLNAGSPSPVAGTPHTRGHLSHERFLREARAAATLSHPNICAIFDTGEQDGRPYLVMELLRGETLKQYLVKSGLERPLSPDEVVAFSQQAASALSVAHAAGIVHRDIKPANLFVSQAAHGRKQIKILDFGLAKKQGTDASPDSRAVSAASSGPATGSDATGATAATGVANADLTSPGSTIGTIAYMSPEQAKGQPLDARTDLFSLGAVIYEMSTGSKPFPGQSTAEVFAALLTKDPAPVSSVNSAMPPALDSIVSETPRQRNRAALPLRRRTHAGSRDIRHSRLPQLQQPGHRRQRFPFHPARNASRAHESAASAKTASSKLPALIAALAVVLVIIGGFAWFKHAPTSASHSPATGATPSGPVPSGSAKDSIILASFINQTGDPVFDTTLNQALRIDLEQSPVINVVSEDHLRQSVKYLGKPDDTVITPAIAREIGEREGFKAILTGTIAKLGNEYVITLTAKNTATGDEIASEQVTASDKDHVLPVLGTAAASMRAKLGEDLASIAKLNTPFGQATTPSLEAFRAYALGDVAHGKALNIPEAEGHYLHAIELDPNFAMAYARLGAIYANAGMQAKQNEYFTKAFELSSHVSEVERLYIAGHYYQGVTGNIPKTIETLQESIQTYPAQNDAYVNINDAYEFIGQDEAGLPYGQKAAAMYPEDAITSSSLLTDYLALNRWEEARAEMERAHKLGLDASTDVAAGFLWGYFLLGEPQQVERLVAGVSGRPDEFVVTSTFAVTQQFSGQYRLADATLQRAFEQAGRAKAPDAQASILLANAAGRGLAGLCDGNEAMVKKALALDKSTPTLELAALTAAFCGNGKVALPIAEELGRKTSGRHARARCLSAADQGISGTGRETLAGRHPCRRSSHVKRHQFSGFLCPGPGLSRTQGRRLGDPFLQGRHPLADEWRRAICA